MGKSIGKDGAPSWAPGEFNALVKKPGTHKYPGRSGFYMRVSPKGKVVFGYHFRIGESEYASGKLGEYFNWETGHGLSLEEALKKFDTKYRIERASKNLNVRTLDDGFLEWMDKSVNRTGGGEKSLETKENYLENYTRFLLKHGQLVLARTESSQWEGILDEVRKRSPSSARICYWTISAIYRRGVQLKRVESNPLAIDELRNKFAGRASRGKKRKTHISAINLRAFVSGLFAVPNRGHGRRVVFISLLTGWRRSAVMRLKWEQIDFANKLYEVKPHDIGWKGYEGTIAISDFVWMEIQRRIDAGGQVESEYVFPGAYGSKKEYMQNAQGTIDSACKKAGIPRIVHHDLRRTFSTIADIVHAGNQRLTGLLLGHRQPQSEDANPLTGDYTMRDFAAERVSANQVGEAIFVLADVWPRDDDIFKVFENRGVNLDALKLVEMEDDDADAPVVDVTVAT